MNTKIEQVRSFFAEPARYLRSSFNIRIRADAVQELTGDTAFASILDIGCGTGAISQPLLPRAEHLTLLDFSPGMLSMALGYVPAKSLGKVETINDDFMHAALKSNSYDLILCMGVLAHVNSPVSVVDKMVSLLKPGGQIIVQNTDSGHFVSALFALYTAAQRTFSHNSYRLNQLSGERLTRMFRERGLTQMSVYRYSLPIPGMARILSSDRLYELIRRVYGTPSNNRFSWLGNECIYQFRKVEQAPAHPQPAAG